jgi:hypothetical protein
VHETHLDIFRIELQRLLQKKVAWDNPPLLKIQLAQPSTRFRVVWNCLERGKIFLLRLFILTCGQFLVAPGYRPRDLRLLTAARTEHYDRKDYNRCERDPKTHIPVTSQVGAL